MKTKQLFLDPLPSSPFSNPMNKLCEQDNIQRKITRELTSLHSMGDCGVWSLIAIISEITSPFPFKAFMAGQNLQNWFQGHKSVFFPDCQLSVLKQLSFVSTFDSLSINFDVKQLDLSSAMYISVLERYLSTMEYG